MSSEGIIVDSSSRQARHQHLIIWGTVSILTFGAVVVLGVTGFGNQKRRANKAKNDRTESLEQLCNVLNSLPDEEWAIVKRKLDAFLLGDFEQNAEEHLDDQQQKTKNSFITENNISLLGSPVIQRPSTVVISSFALNDVQEKDSVPTLKNGILYNQTDSKVELAFAPSSIDSKGLLIANEERKELISSSITTTKPDNDGIISVNSTIGGTMVNAAVADSTLKSESVAPELARFRTMLKVGIHPDAVRLKMTAEGLDPSLIFNQEESNLTTSMSSVSNATVVEKQEEPVLPKPKDPALAKYETMLKVGIHPEAVKAKMKLEGIDPDCLFAHSSSSSSSLSNNNSNDSARLLSTSNPQQQQQQQQQQLQKQPQRMMTISTPLGELIPVEKLSSTCIWRRHQPTNEANVEVDDLTRQRIFSLFKPPTNSSTTIKQSKQSIMNQQQQFRDENESVLGVNCTRITNSGKKKRLASGGGSSSTKTSTPLLPARRAQNLQIGFAKFKLDPETICNAILKMEPEVFGRKDDDNLQLLMRLLPTEDEMKSFGKYDGDELRLSDVEKLFRLLAIKVPDVSIRVESMIFVVRFPIQVKDIRSEMDMMRRAIKLLHDSQALFVVLKLCLDIGLTISSSSSTTGGEVSQKKCGLSIHGLGDRLTRSKTQDGKLTIADIVAGLFRQQQDQLKSQQPLPLMEPSFSNFRSLTLVENEIAELERGIERRSRLEATMDVDSSQGDAKKDDETFVVKTAKKEVNVLRNQFEQTRSALASALEYFGEPTDRPLGIFFQDMCSIIGCIQSALVTNKFASLTFKLPPQTENE